MKYIIALAVVLGVGALVMQARKPHAHEELQPDLTQDTQYKKFNWSQGTLIVPREGIFASYKPPFGDEQTIFSLIYKTEWNEQEVSFQLFGDQYHIDQSAFDFLNDFEPITNADLPEFKHLKLYDKTQFESLLLQETGPAGSNAFFSREGYFMAYMSKRPYPVIYSPVFRKIFVIVIRADVLYSIVQMPVELEPDLPNILAHIDSLIEGWKREGEADVK